MTKESLIALLVLIVLIYIIKSKHTPIIIKNNIKAYLIQTFIALFTIVKMWISETDLYENSSSCIIYNISGFTKDDYYYELIVRIIAMSLYVIFGMLLTNEKSKYKNFLSVFICYIVLVIRCIVTSISMEDIYVWIPYIFIGPSTHASLQKATPIVYNTVFFILLFIPTLFMWIGMELKELYDKKFIKKE
ncbi:TPA: hypothetical protein LA742_002177 [Clostridium botulinum]|uniref:hypothetical protein n=1 Tax=Clostridium TaxID=1485 RepID=UPI000A798052|nr:MULTISPECIES: hypothetical protein [Clostridium]AVQ51901.1 hypothetical protein C7M59_03100 [Clostridium botulinum]HBJ2613706.1 hypothetical protein [Clostridium botulinum]